MISFDDFFKNRHGNLPIDKNSEEYADKLYLKHEMQKAWQKAKAQAVPEGYVLVPKVANKKMVNAGYEAHDGFYTNGQVQNVYQAMIKAIESGAEQ